MKITVESTDRIVDIRNRRNGDITHGRIWEGHTDTGIPVQCVIVSIATPEQQNQAQFISELKERKAPEQEQAFPPSMIL